MLHLSLSGLADESGWQSVGVELPQFDIGQMVRNTEENPQWIHFGLGQIFRAFVANCQQKLLDTGKAETGIISVVPHDMESIDKLYKPHDQLTLLVQMNANGDFQKKVVASIAEVLGADPQREQDDRRLAEIFEHPGLQMVSFTITEKGYSLTGADGEYLDSVRKDMANGPERPEHLMSKIASLAYRRYLAGAYPLTFVSLDNCSHNGDKLMSSIVAIAKEWAEKGWVEPNFLTYLEDESRVAFPLTMIDKITPRPSEKIKHQLEQLGIAGMDMIGGGGRSFNAPFVNAESSGYLVIEDKFAGGRPPLEEAGVIFTDRDTVIKVETMKVTTCLNPLHTALAVTGCLLGYSLIADEMKDDTLRRLVEKIGYDEGLPVVVDPGILNPRAFLDTVLQERFPNPFIPDTPQRIAADTSQKVGIRFGETIKSYRDRKDLNPAELTGIPLAIAAWCRYLLGVDDEGKPMRISPDPLLEMLQKHLSGTTLGAKTSAVRGILEEERLFGVRLYEVGLGEKIEGLFHEMLEGPGAVRRTLEKYLKKE
ncbi:mannitol dehydrogenase [Paenibacillus yonginensis]|uniref:Mannitol dehydrogenase n=1 Tax=Paenibacillus yonginensis TaxID=1462996 RepID=A0A1B1MZF8_9BACL|nr:mannitol dehydrogenase family protein [Paenibacillus yonginensis]ANS74563.1 mannitol dehydrogenase [Paenibacillus yonginensis]